jgi:hypothetical protein
MGGLEGHPEGTRAFQEHLFSPVVCGKAAPHPQRVSPEDQDMVTWSAFWRRIAWQQCGTIRAATSRSDRGWLFGLSQGVSMTRTSSVHIAL